MSAIGTLVFCTKCGNILPQSLASKKAVLICDCCGTENKGQDMEPGPRRVGADC
jgi:DNA-directed RNA polymerase I subunit RPA12